MFSFILLFSLDHMILFSILI